MRRHAFWLVLLAGCSSSTPASERHATPLATLRAVPAFTARVGAAGTLTRDGAGYHGAHGSIRVTLPNLANGSAHVVHHALPDAWIDVRPQGLQAKPGHAQGAAVTFNDA